MLSVEWNAKTSDSLINACKAVVVMQITAEPARSRRAPSLVFG
jgi:hypothetical protein